jgi:heme ABC exporter ATP-binding subunit CcmA
MSPSASLHDATVVLEDHPVLRGVSFEVAPGLTLVQGPNGAGKTTLLRALSGLVPLAGGSRAVPDAPLYIGHRSMLLGALSARANLEFLASFRGRPNAAVVGALERWGLGREMDRSVDRLSAGQRRRAALARLDTEATERHDVALLDEPFADLDADGAAVLRATLRAALARGQAIVLVTHQHDEIDREARARFVIERGKLQPA